MLVTQATETQQKQNIFRRCPVFSAVALQWWWQMQSCCRNSIRLLQKSSRWEGSILPLPLRGQRYPVLHLSSWSLLLWWYTTGVHGLGVLAVLRNSTKIVFPRTEQYIWGPNRQCWGGSTLSFQHWYEHDSEKELELSVFSYTLCWKY